MAPLQGFRSVNTLSGLLLTCPTKDQQVHETPADSFGCDNARVRWPGLKSGPLSHTSPEARSSQTKQSQGAGMRCKRFTSFSLSTGGEVREVYMAYGVHRPPNYPLLYPKYPLLRAIRTLLEGTWGVLVHRL